MDPGVVAIRALEWMDDPFFFHTYLWLMRLGDAETPRMSDGAFPRGHAPRKTPRWVR